MKQVVVEAIEDEFGVVSTFILEQNFFEKGIKYVFALLTKHSLQLYEDMHMNTEPLAEYEYQGLTFIDLGMAIHNQQRNAKYHFIKVVYDD